MPLSSSTDSSQISLISLVMSFPLFVCGYDQDYLTCITWGQLKKLTWNFWKAYCDEAHALLSQDWLDASPLGFDLATLQADLQAITGG